MKSKRWIYEVNPPFYIVWIGLCQNQPQPLDPQDPDEHPPPPMGLVEEMPKPERGPASMYSTLISPHVSSRLSSTRKVNSF